MDKAKLNLVSMSVKFENFQPITNTGFVRGECKVAYAGKNRNYSNIFKEAFEKAQPTIFGIPVVGNWLGDNYGGHDLIIETKGNDVIFKDATVPFGFVPQDANPRWESVEDENGNSKSYHVVDVILWKERYPEQIQFVEDNGANQSMEIMVKDGDWDENWEYFNVNDFYYSALCLLGRDIDENGNKGDADVEPCFEDSEVITKSFNMTEKFKKDLFAIRSAFEGGERVEDKEKLEDFTEDVAVEETIETQEIFEEEEVVAKSEEIIKDFDEDTTEEATEVEEEFVEEVEQEDFESKHNTLLQEFELLNINYKTLEKEVIELREYKVAKESEITNEQKDTLIGDYSLLLTEEEVEIAIADKHSMTYAEIEINLSKAFAMKSLQNVRNKKTDKKDETVIFEAKTFENNKGKNKFAI